MGFNDFLKKLFGNKSQRDIREVDPYIKKIKAIFPELEKLSNDELRARIDNVKKNLQERVRADRERIAQIKAEIENTDYDKRTLAFAKEYSDKLLAIDVNLNTTEMLDVTWGLFAKYFKPEEVNIRQELVDTYWKK